MESGPTGRAVVDNLARLRKGMTLNQLSERTEEAGRKLSVSALSLIAKGKRRVDVDDLMALAVALDISPITLLMPETGSAEEEVSATGLTREVAATNLWDWLCADHSVHGEDWFSFRMRAWPKWKADLLSKELHAAYLRHQKADDGDD